jgi:hypothetical protein
MSTPTLFPSSSSSLLHFYAYIDKRKLNQTVKVCAKFTARTSKNLSRYPNFLFSSTKTKNRSVVPHPQIGNLFGRERLLEGASNHQHYNRCPPPRETKLLPKSFRARMSDDCFFFFFFFLGFFSNSANATKVAFCSRPMFILNNK